MASVTKRIGPECGAPLPAGGACLDRFPTLFVRRGRFLGHPGSILHASPERVLEATFAHDERGLRALCATLVRLGVGLVAIERPDGLLVEGQRVMGWREALGELGIAYPGRLR